MSDDSKSIQLHPFLMYPDRDFEPDREIIWNADDLIKDLELNTVLDRMARDDKQIREISRKGLMDALHDPNEVRYRQEVVKDAINNSDAIRSLLSLLLEASKKVRERMFWFTRSNPSLALRESIAIMRIYLETFVQVKVIAEENVEKFNSKGFQNLFHLFINELGDEYRSMVEDQLHKLTFPNGVGVVGNLGDRNEFVNFQLTEPDLTTGLRQTIEKMKQRKYTYIVPDRDESGPVEIENMRVRGVISVVNTMRRSANNVSNFINTLASELSFLTGCINLHEDLKAIKTPICFPSFPDEEKGELLLTGLYDIALGLRENGKIVTNDLTPTGQKLIIVTGANRGGKSTFLRSLGQSLLMMWSGMFVGAKTYQAPLYKQLFTHFKREEDKTVTMGKFEEELERMSEMIDHMKPGCIVLFNESFAATNAREGAEIAGNIVNALLETGNSVIFVTHLYELGSLFMNRGSDEVRFLKADHRDSGERTFRIIDGYPEETSYGEELYDKVFSKSDDKATETSAKKENA